MKEEESTEVRDFGLLLGTQVEGELPLLVGGHAVNLWAWFFRSRIGKALDQWLPLTSKDLDLVGTVALLDELKLRFGGKYRLSGPRSPVVGQLVVMLGGKNLKIDVLKDVFGLGSKDLAIQAPIIEVEDRDGAFSARVIPPVVLLQAKIANAARLDQTGRNDRKHVHLMLLVIRAYLSELVEATEAGLIDSRIAVIQLELARKVATSPDAGKCSALHGINFDGIWPRGLLNAAQESRLRNFVRHRLPTSD